jgi:tetratricopeptide (TPR) repeat protein
MEELFAASVEEADRVAFISLLAAFVATGCVWIVATLRADFYAPMLKQPGLKSLKELGATYDLSPPGPVELAEIVREPTAAAGIVYETDPTTGVSLDARILSEADRPDMLPLVQLALSRLFERCVTTEGETHLSVGVYEQLGGLKGIVEEAGKSALAHLGAAEVARLPRLLRLLALPAAGYGGDGPRTLTIRPAPLSQAAPDATARRLVDALVTARLLTTSRNEEGGQVRLSHQRVLEDWDQARAIVHDSADFYRIRNDVEASRNRWNETKRRSELLLPKGLPLAEAESVAGKYRDELEPLTLAYIKASRSRVNRAQLLGWGLAAIFAAVAIGAGYWAKVAFDEKSRADANMNAAKQATDTLVFDIAQGLRDAPGMRVETLRRILESAQSAVERLADASSNDPQLMRSQIVVYGNIAMAYLEAGALTDAATAGRKSIDIARLVVAKNPGHVPAQRDLSLSLNRMGDVKLGARDRDGALAAYQESLDIGRMVAVQAPADTEAQSFVPFSLNRIGDVKLESGDSIGALAAYQESLDIGRTLAAKEPANKEIQRAVPFSLNRIGNVKLRSGDRDGALGAFQEGLEAGRKLAIRDPGNTVLQRDVALGLNSIGDIKVEFGDSNGALAAYQESREVVRKLAARDPGNTVVQRDVAISQNRIGLAKLKSGDRDGALAAYQEGLEIVRKLVAQDPGNTVVQRDVVFGLNGIGNVKLEYADRDGALAAYQEGLEVLRKLDPADAEVQRDISYSLSRIEDVKLQSK